MDVEEVIPVLSVNEKQERNDSNQTQHPSESNETKTPIIAHTLKNGQTTLKVLPQTGSDEFITSCFALSGIGIVLIVICLRFIGRRNHE